MLAELSTAAADPAAHPDELSISVPLRRFCGAQTVLGGDPDPVISIG